MTLLRPVSILVSSAAPLAPAPSVASNIQGVESSSTSTPTLAKGALSWSSGQLMDVLISIGSSPTLTDAAGDSDDVDGVITNGGTTPKLYLRSWTVNGGAVDANLVFTLSGSSRAVMQAIVYSGATGRSAAAVTSSTGTALLSPAITITGGPRNVLAMTALNILGAHVTNPPDPPSGYTLVGTSLASTSDNPALTSRSTMAVAYKVVNDATTSVAAAQWLGAEDYTSQAWNAISWAMYA